MVLNWDLIKEVYPVPPSRFFNSSNDKKCRFNGFYHGQNCMMCKNATLYFSGFWPEQEENQSIIYYHFDNGHKIARKCTAEKVLHAAVLVGIKRKSWDDEQSLQQHIHFTAQKWKLPIWKVSKLLASKPYFQLLIFRYRLLLCQIAEKKG